MYFFSPISDFSSNQKTPVQLQSVVFLSAYHSYQDLTAHGARFSALLLHHLLQADGIAVADLLEEGAARAGVIAARHCKEEHNDGRLRKIAWMEREASKTALLVIAS